MDVAQAQVFTLVEAKALIVCKSKAESEFVRCIIPSCVVLHETALVGRCIAQMKI